MTKEKKERKHFEQFTDQIVRLYPELHTTDNPNVPDDEKILSRSITFQVTDDCNLACKYCYQINKSKRKMSLEIAKKFVDLLLDATPENNAYINPVVSPFLIIEFIGGEPLLEVRLMDQIMDYFLSQALERMHPWVDKYMISISSNGTLYFEPEVQKFLLKHRGHLSLSITIDGNKELHDSCRVFHDGRPSYDLAVAAAQDWMKTHKGYMGSKITIAPENVIYLYDALVHMVELGYEEINANCVYEKGWELGHATELYNQMKRFADYCLENDKTYIFYSLYEDIFFRPMGDDENENWCWGKGTPILTSGGYKPIEEIKIGDLVYTEDGTIHPVVRTTSHFADNCVKISASGIFPLVCTDNHKLYAKKNSIYGKYEVKSLNTQDKIRTFINDTFGWTNGLVIKDTFAQMVYNLTIDTNHSYIAGGIVSANCGGTGAMLSCDPDGYLYPCIRYMESSLGEDQPPIIIGHVDRGLVVTEEEKETVRCLDCITRRSQSTDECYFCPIARGCAWCFPAGTKVSTPNGLVNIEDVKPGDTVLDKDGNTQQVSNNLKRDANDLLYVKAAGLHDILTTEEHPFWCKPVISRPHNIPVYGEPRWVPAKKLNTTDRIALFIPKLGEIDVNNDLAYLLGRYVGDGWKTPSNRKKHPYRYYICTPFKEQEILETYFKRAGVTYNKTLNKTVAEYNVHITGENNQYLTELFEDCGRYAKDKHVPRAVWTWNRLSVESFLRGYFDADGYYDQSQNSMRFTSTSYELILNISELIRAVYHTNVSISQRIPKPTTVIDGRTVNQSISYEGRYRLDTPSHKYYEFDEQNNILWINIVPSKKKIPEKSTVFNLSVENNPTFIANGAIVHNCSALNYQEFGTVDKRATYICEMHKARSLANVYYWNKVYAQNGELDENGKPKKFKMHCPKEWAVPIIGEEEYFYLLELSGGNENED